MCVCAAIRSSRHRRRWRERILHCNAAFRAYSIFIFSNATMATGRYSLVSPERLNEMARGWSWNNSFENQLSVMRAVGGGVRVNGWTKLMEITLHSIVWSRFHEGGGHRSPVPCTVECVVSEWIEKCVISLPFRSPSSWLDSIKSTSWANVLTRARSRSGCWY